MFHDVWMPRTLQENVWLLETWPKKHWKTIATNVFQLSTDCNYHPLHPKLHLHLNCFRICISYFISHLTTASQLLTDCTSLPLVLIPSWESWSWIWWEYTNSIWQIPFVFLPLMNVIIHSQFKCRCKYKCDSLCRSERECHTIAKI